MMKLQILGKECKKFQLLSVHAEAAAKELGIDYAIEKITDIREITDMGVKNTPALAIDGSVVISGKSSSPEEIKKFLEIHDFIID